MDPLAIASYYKLKVRFNSQTDCWQVVWCLGSNSKTLVCAECETKAEADGFVRGVKFYSTIHATEGEE